MNRRIKLLALSTFLTLRSAIATAGGLKNMFLGSGVSTPYTSSRSLLLGGTNECLTAADNATFTQATFCVGFDVKANVQASGRVIYSHYDYGTPANMAWSVWTDGTASRLNFIVSDNGNYDATHTKDYKSSVGFLDGSWHSAKFCFNGPASTIRIWKDGVEDTTLTKTFDPAITTTFNSTVSLAIGCDHASGTGTRADFFVGRLDRLYISSVDLSATNMGTGSAKTDLSGVAGIISLWDVKSTDSSTSVADQVGGRTMTGFNLESTDIDVDI